MFARTRTIDLRIALAAVGLVAACGATPPPTGSDEAAAATTLAQRRIANATKACENDRAPDKVRNVVAPAALAEDEVQRVPPEAKADLKERVAAESAGKPPAVAVRSLAVNPALEHEARVNRFLAEEVKLRDRFGSDEAGLAKARADLKQKIILGTP